MGHIDLRLLPATAAWRRVLGVLGEHTANPSDVAYATASAAQDRMARLRGDENLAYCVWLLVRLASAARSSDFAEALAQLGIDPRRSGTMTGFLAQVNARVRAHLDQTSGSGPFGELAMQALSTTLADTIGSDGALLFGSTLEDVERALHRNGTPTRVGHLVARFFGEFLGRVLRFYIDRALPLQIGPGGGFATIHDSEVFVLDLSAYARTVATVIDPFAGEWFSLHQWQSNGAIGRAETTGFVAHALDKLEVAVLRQEAAA